MKKIVTNLLLISILSTNIIATPIYSYKNRFHPIIATNGMVATQEEHASKVGLDILKQGGNAIDAAVAIGYALSVTLPRAGNLGGGGFMLVYIKEDNKTYVIDYREKAPLAASKDMFLDEHGNVINDLSQYSLLSSGVPGTVAGLNLALNQFGSMPLKKVIKPAITLAEKGFPVSYDLNQSMPKGLFEKTEVGETLIQKDLAWSLKEISRNGSNAFYNGKIAKKLVTYMKENGGLITQQDLDYYYPKVREPITGTYKGYTIVTMPPPSSGGIHLVQLLNTLEHFNLEQSGHNTADTIHLMTEAMKYAYADRSEYLGDPDFIEVPTKKLTSKAYGKQLAEKISTQTITTSDRINPVDITTIPESPETTHFVVADKYGNVVSNTYTLNFSYGNRIIVPGTGIILNNQMDDFSAKPGFPNAYGLIGGENNAIAPEKRMLSSMTPTIVFKDGNPYLITGTPGGSRIITTTLQVLLNVIDHNMNIAEATAAPRIHHQWLPDEIRVEKGLNKDITKNLEKRGYIVKEKQAMGSSQSILIQNDTFYGSSDPRKPGALTIGY